MIGTAALVLIFALVYLRAPKQTLMALPIIFVFQAAAVALVGGRDSTIGALLQNVDEASLTAVLVTTVVVALLMGHPLLVRRWVYWYGLFLVAALLSILLEGSGWQKGAVGLLLLSKGFIYAFAIEQMEWSPVDVTALFRMILCAAGIVLVFALPDLVAPISFRTLMGFDTLVDYRNGLPSVMSLLGHPGGYGWFMAVGALIAMAHMINESGSFWKVLFVLFVFGAALSLRRKPIIGILVSAAIVIPLYGHRLRRRLTPSVFAMLALVALPLTFVFLPILLRGVQGYISTDALTTQARTALYAGAVLLAHQHFPLGAGIGRYGSYGSVVQYSDIYYQFGFNLIFGMSPTYSNFIQDTFWPQIVGETGVLGLIGYGGAILSLLLSVLKLGRRDSSPAMQSLYLAALLIAVETLLESVAAPSYTVPAQACLSLGLLSLVAMVAAARVSAATDTTKSSHAS